MRSTRGGESEATREAGWRRLEAFLPSAWGYADRRDHVEPPGHANVSGLSPWLQKRLVLEEEVIAAARAWWGYQRVEKFIQEACWRTYWKGWMEHHPEAWDRWMAAVPARRDGLTGAQRSDYEAAIAGRTDIECFNAWAREIRETGWLHHQARRWFASIWIFTLRLPWELGAAFFHEHLRDGDAASNTLSWRRAAGLHGQGTQGAQGTAYLAREDEIAMYSRDHYQMAPGRLATQAVDFSEAPLGRVEVVRRPSGWREAGVVAGPGAARAGLWLHPEDLCAEVGGLADAPVAAVFAAWPTGIGRQAGWSSEVERWTRAALADGAMRAARRFECEVETGEVDDLPAAMTQWTREQKLEVVLVHEPMQGAWRPAARAAEAALAMAGVRLVWIRRKWDDRLWPHATGEFGAFWEAVKREQGLG